MHRFLAILVLAQLAAVPAHAGEVEPLAVAKAMIDAINERNLDALDDLVAADVRRHCAATPDAKVTNLAEFKAFLESDFAAVPDSVITVDVIFGNDEYVAMRAIYAGTQSGPMGPFPPSGKRFELPYIGILEFEEGKIAQIWVEWDNLYALTQLGHIDLAGKP
jgi:steroid delta-isomerase-like uncharacterized protein